MLTVNQPMMSRRTALKMGAGFAAAGLAGRGAFAETDISRATVTGSKRDHARRQVQAFGQAAHRGKQRLFWQHLADRMHGLAAQGGGEAP